MKVKQPILNYALSSVLVDELKFPIKQVSKALATLSEYTQDSRYSSFHSWEALSRWLEESGARQKWNKHFWNIRSQFIANWVFPFLKGESLLDLLCGNGQIGQKLKKHKKVFFVERVNVYPELSNYIPDCIDFNDFTTYKKTFDTVLLCTVLHHEIDPEHVLSLAVQSTSKRLIIIENCIDSLFDAYFQQAIDLFYNECLNKTSLPTTNQHRTMKDWVILAQKYEGTLVDWHYYTRIPGIPMPHDLLVFEFNKGG